MSPKLPLDRGERRQLNVLAAQYAIFWATIIGSAFTVAALLLLPKAVLDALYWYPFAFVIAFYLKRRALLNRAGKMLEDVNTRMAEDR